MVAQLFTFVTDCFSWLCSWWQPTQQAPRLTLAMLSGGEYSSVPDFVQNAQAAQRCITLLGSLDWAHFPERSTSRCWPGPQPIPRAAFVAAYLLKLDKGLKSMPKLREYLTEQPALVWLLGFPVASSAAYPWGFDVEQSLPTARHFSRVLRELDQAQVSFLLKNSVQLLECELPDGVKFGEAISLDTKHILAWVRENNPKARIKDRFDKMRQPKGDPDCKVGCKKRENKPPQEQTPETPTQEGQPASQVSVGEFYWGYASGIVATKVDAFGEFVLAELTQTFDMGDQSYFHPLMAQTEENLGRKPQFGALDKAFDAFYVYEYFHNAGGFAAVPWADRKDHKKVFTDDGLPLCRAALAMPRKSTFMKKSHCLVPHQCARYACPLLFPEATGEHCPIDHPQWPKGGCITTLPTSPGNRIRHELDRESAAYERIYKQRTASERINSQALDLGIERPKLRNQHSIAHQNTLIYVLINLRALQRVRQIKAAQAQGQAPDA